MCTRGTALSAFADPRVQSAKADFVPFLPRFQPTALSGALWQGTIMAFTIEAYVRRHLEGMTVRRLCQGA
jgi:hypothetical protein